MRTSINLSSTSSLIPENNLWEKRTLLLILKIMEICSLYKKEKKILIMK